MKITSRILRARYNVHAGTLHGIVVHNLLMILLPFLPRGGGGGVAHGRSRSLLSTLETTTSAAAGSFRDYGGKRPGVSKAMLERVRRNESARRCATLLEEEIATGLDVPFHDVSIFTSTPPAVATPSVLYDDPQQQAAMVIRFQLFSLWSTSSLNASLDSDVWHSLKFCVILKREDRSSAYQKE